MTVDWVGAKASPSTLGHVGYVEGREGAAPDAATAAKRIDGSAQRSDGGADSDDRRGQPRPSCSCRDGVRQRAIGAGMDG